MHVLLIHQAFAGLNEAGGTRHHEFARYLVRQGHRVTVLTGQISYLTGEATTRRAWVDRQTDEQGVEIWRCFTTRAYHRSFVHRVISFLSFTLSSFLLGLRVKDIDLVWGTSPPIFQGLTAWALARLKGARLLFEVRDLWPKFAIAVGVLHNPLLIRLANWLEGFLYRRADQIVVNSPGFIDHVQALHGRPVALVPNGVDSRMFDPEADGQAFRRRHRLGDGFVALYAGAHGMSNDLGVVLHAAQELSEHPEISIALLGDGKEKPALIALASALGLKNVRFLSPVPKSLIPQALAASDACIAILKPIAAYKTTYPNKVFDYLAAGRPVVLAIDGVIRRLVEEAGAGLFVPPGDPRALAQALADLAADPQAARAMGLAGRQYVARHFDRAILAEEMLKTMLATVSPGPHTSGHEAEKSDQAGIEGAEESRRQP